jgi:hypothetical protein
MLMNDHLKNYENYQSRITNTLFMNRPFFVAIDLVRVGPSWRQYGSQEIT